MSFFDTLIYFNVMVAVAGLIYQLRGQTIYESVLSSNVSVLTNTTSLLLTPLYEEP